MNGIEVGILNLAHSGAMACQYHSEWLNRHDARAISLPLTAAPYRGEVIYNFFDNLLPDSEMIRARMQAWFHVPTRHPFDLLASIGRDCIGAIQLYPQDVGASDVRHISAEPLDDPAIEALLAGYHDAPLGMVRDEDFRISLKVAAPHREHPEVVHEIQIRR